MPRSSPSRWWSCLLAALAVHGMAGAIARAEAAAVTPIPFVKRWTATAARIQAERVTLRVSDPSLMPELDLLSSGLRQAGVIVGDEGIPITLERGDAGLPEHSSPYRDEIRDQGYRIEIRRDAIRIRARTATGVYYGVQTLLQLRDAKRGWPCGELLDWPDLAVRGIMLDVARANENARYYREIVRFCGRYKLNRLHLHLSDDQNVCLHHDGYRSVMHPRAWTPEQFAPLIELAQRHHVEVVPEIESLGHARVFLRHPAYQEFLHQTTENKPAGSWSGTTVQGYTNVLCPASPAAGQYLDDMVARVAEVFPGPEIHIGLDEVDMTTCARCTAAYGEEAHEAWFLRHLLACKARVASFDRRTALWGDMLLRHRAVVDSVPTEGTVVYDWHYRPDVSADSLRFFKSKGFEAIACPALVCWPHMILPSADNYANIERFATIARGADARGMVTTVWIPTRYLSDALWPGLAMAAAHAWSGSAWDEIAACCGIMRDFFGSPEGDAFARVWRDLAQISWRLKEFRTGCWYDEKTLAAARAAAAGEPATRARREMMTLMGIGAELQRLGRGVTKHREAWRALERSVAIHAYVRMHFTAAVQVSEGIALRQPVVEHLHEQCRAILGWIEEDWDRNRFADDPYKADLNQTGQHLLDRFRRMEAFLPTKMYED